MARCRHGFELTVIPCEFCAGGPRSPLNPRTASVQAKRAEGERKRRARIGDGLRVSPELYTAFGKAGKL